MAALSPLAACGEKSDRAGAIRLKGIFHRSVEFLEKLKRQRKEKGGGK